MKLPFALIAIACLLSPCIASRARGDEQALSYRFEYRITKERASRNKKGSSANNTTVELWNYKVEVENRSLQDVGELDVKYTCYISTETRVNGSRKETTRNIVGDGTLAAMPRGSRASMDTKTVTLKQSEKTERIKSKGQPKNNGKKKKPQIKITEVTSKLDGIVVKLYLDGKLVGEHALGGAARRQGG